MNVPPRRFPPSWSVEEPDPKLQRGDILLIDCPFSMACHGVRGRRNVVAFEEPIIHFEEMLRRQKP